MSSAILNEPPLAPLQSFTRRTIEDLQLELGGIPAQRIRLVPLPGTATEADAYWVNENECPCELIDGTLVEKPMGNPQAFLASLIGYYLNEVVVPKSLGAVIGPDAQYRMIHGNLRMPDVSFTARERLPSPLPQIGGWCPDLCIEVISPSNTKAEITRKRTEFFESGCRLFWEINPKTRSAVIYKSVSQPEQVDEAGTLSGEPVLPNFVLTMKKLFDAYDQVPMQSEETS